MSYKKMTLFDAYTKISAQAERLNLSQAITNRAKVLFKHSHERNILRMRRPIDAKVSTCLYFACRQGGFPRTFKELCAVSTSSKRSIGRCFKLIMKETSEQVVTISTYDFMQRFCDKLNLPSNVQRTA